MKIHIVAHQPPCSGIKGGRACFANVFDEEARCTALSKKAPLPCIDTVDTTDLSTAKVEFLRAHGRTVAHTSNVPLERVQCEKIVAK